VFRKTHPEPDESSPYRTILYRAPQRIRPSQSPCVTFRNKLFLIMKSC
jgi:hypothetical protein